MILYYAKDGTPISENEREKAWKLMEDREYKIIKQDFTPGGKYWVSTVWLGIDHSFGWFHPTKPNPHPIIFETMVFQKKWSLWETVIIKGKQFLDWLPGKYYFFLHDDVAQVRYETEAEAIEGHVKMLKKWSKK